VGEVAIKRCTPWHNGTWHLVMSPPEFMQMLTLSAELHARAVPQGQVAACLEAQVPERGES
jgi:hypothetical protein